MTFGDKLRELRQAAALSQPDLASASGVSLSAVRNYEQGHRVPSWRAIVKLSRVLGVAVDAFSACDEVADEPKGKKKPKPRG